MAQGTIRIRCKVCRKAGIKDGYTYPNPLICKHKEAVWEASYPRPTGGHDRACYYFSPDPAVLTQLKRCQLFRSEKQLLYAKNPQYQPPQAILFEDYIKKYLQEAIDSGTVEPMSWTNYESTIRLYLQPILGGHHMSSITPEMIKKVKSSVAHMSASVQEKVGRHLNGIFRDARFEKLIYENPTENLKKRKKAPSIIYEILSVQQIKDLLNQARNSFLIAYYMLPIWAGLRSSEVAGLRVQDLDFERDRIHIRQKIRYFNNRREMKDAKSDKRWFAGEGPDGLKSPAAYRTIPMSPVLKKALQIYLIERSENAYGLVFSNSEGEPVDHRIISRLHFRRDKKNAGIPTIKYHELRHTYCSILIKNGLSRGIVDLKRIQEWMGHSQKDMTTTWGIYTQIIQDARDDSEVMKSFDDFIDKPEKKQQLPVSTLCQDNVNEILLN